MRKIKLWHLLQENLHFRTQLVHLGDLVYEERYIIIFFVPAVLLHLSDIWQKQKNKTKATF